tara:strand:+ start:2392 stop:3339 length:948 start_codon:yes stop_codon:yes gene_type:complete
MKKEFLLLTTLLSIGFFSYIFLPDGEKNNINPIVFDEQVENISENQKNELLSFDIVRITKEGDTVIAGRSNPNQEVMIFEGEQKLASIKADMNGEWVWTSETPLKSGVKRLHLKSKNLKNEVILSSQTIIVFLENNEINEPIVLRYGNKSSIDSEILNLEKIDDGIILDILTYSEDGRLILSGRTTPKKRVTLYLNKSLFGYSKSNENGFWNFTSKEEIESGKSQLRIDVTNNGELKTFTTTIFNENVDNFKIKLKDKVFIVKPGNSLWRIARKTLGGGILYSEIYKKNLMKIKDPNMIFPGQVFDIPIISKEQN